MRDQRLISEFIILSTGKLIITLHILPNISRGKCNHTVIVCQLIEY